MGGKSYEVYNTHFLNLKYKKSKLQLFVLKFILN